MPTAKTVTDVMNMPRTETNYVLRADLDTNGAPTIVTVARIVTAYPKDGMGRLYVAVTDWGHDGNAYPPTQFVSHASGIGYDKRTAALTGASVGGVVIGDHCDHAGRPTLDKLAHTRGYRLF